MNDTYYYVTSGSCALVGMMDRLWFDQIILFPGHPGSEPRSGDGFDGLDLNEEEIPSHPAITTCDESDEASDQSCLSMEDDKPRPCDHSGDSLSPCLAKDQGRRLRKWYSYSDPKSLRKSFEDLEMEEVKGFMDLGFVFEKEHLSRRMMSVIPGLQRLGLADSDDGGDVDAEFEGDKNKIRPYLSEAWLVMGPDSPLSKLRIPDEVCASSDMKKHLKRWARTVASVIKLES